MKSLRPNSLATFAVILFGIALFYWGTDGFTAYTAESARVNRLLDARPTFPQTTFEDSKGRSYSISEFEGKYVFLTFFYSACSTVCVQLEGNMGRVYETIPAERLGREIVFLSVSFDPDRDDPARLEEYRTFFDSDGETWRMARVPDRTELNRLLDEFGVIVIPDESGGFAHNSAFYLVDPAGTLIDVMDYTRPEEAANEVARILDQERGDGG
ncbi:SCO family protein [Cohnella sp. CIP 111063]|jgi:protein SCO1/2|uniref:SCO family protein n=1 Tax=unclassified Cohnella TaxID=2636738 RepID=UPI000B8BCEBD|nr:MULTISPECIES: SCO family protein [unclassified Cohnella]OXS60373.1 SCO family protein [Cohnella sp. CIP 111063]PRX73071.1 protein SCO1/2 [Cohnella sp. SGD-V74]